MEKALKHYLLSLPFPIAPDYYVHSYLVCSGDQQTIENVANEMVNEAEKQDVWFLPIVMSTALNPKTAKKVRAYVNEVIPESIETMATMTDFHRTTWADQGPDWLVKIH